jgi:hypothetical protein
MSSISTFGKLLIALVIVVIGFNVIKTNLENNARQEKRRALDAKVKAASQNLDWSLQRMGHQPQPTNVRVVP